MSVFIDKHNRRKSTILLTAFCVGFLFAFLFVALALLLAEPLYDLVRLESDFATTAIHGVIVALAGTAICCAGFLLKDKRIVPYSFAGLAVWLCMFYAAAFLLEGEGRIYMMRTITMFGLPPVLVGNAVTWPIYLRMKRADPTMNHRKTIREELKDAVAREEARHPKAAEAAAPAAEPSDPAPVSGEAPELTEEEALFGPDESAPARRPIYRSAEEEAMLFYEDEEESYD